MTQSFVSPKNKLPDYFWCWEMNFDHLWQDQLRHSLIFHVCPIFFWQEFELVTAGQNNFKIGFFLGILHSCHKSLNILKIVHARRQSLAKDSASVIRWAECTNSIVSDCLHIQVRLGPQSYKNIFSIDLHYTGILALWLAKSGHVTFISQ